MNIGKLKAEIADLPDDMEVSIIIPCNKTMYCRSLDAVKSQIIDDECLLVTEDVGVYNKTIFMYSNFIVLYSSLAL